MLSLIYPEPGMSGFPDFLIYVPTERNKNQIIIITISQLNL